MNRENIRLIIDVVIVPLISAAVFILWDLNKSVNTLNTQVGVILNQNTNLEKRIDRLEEKIFGK